MRVFVTGATGYIGSAVVKALAKAGHHVGGLYRSPEKEQAVRSLGATPIFGHLRDPETYQHFSAECDAVIHTAFEGPDSEQSTAEALLSALVAEGEDKSLIFTSGVWVLGNTNGKAAGEDASTEEPLPIVAWRPALERYVLNGANTQIATAVVRPGLVYGGRKGLFAPFFDSATKEGAALYLGTGENHFAPIHRDDLAQLYRLIAEKRGRGLFHGVDGTAPTILEAATAFSKAAGKNGATRGLPIDVARKQMGAWVDGLALDQTVIGHRSRELGWKPEHASILGSADAAFAEWKG